MTWASFLWLEIQRAQNKYVPVGAVSERCERCHWICFSHAIRADTIKNCRKNCLFSHEFMKWTSLARDSKSPKWFRPVKALSELCHWICCSHEIRADTIKNEGPYPSHAIIPYPWTPFPSCAVGFVSFARDTSRYDQEWRTRECPFRAMPMDSWLSREIQGEAIKIVGCASREPHDAQRGRGRMNIELIFPPNFETETFIGCRRLLVSPSTPLAPGSSSA